jgi:hypothetical protein
MAEENKGSLTVGSVQTDELEAGGMKRFTGFKDDVPVELLPRDTQELGAVIAVVNDLVQRVASIQGQDVPLELAPPPPRD